MKINHRGWFHPEGKLIGYTVVETNIDLDFRIHFHILESINGHIIIATRSLEPLQNMLLYNRKLLGNKLHLNQLMPILDYNFNFIIVEGATIITIKKCFTPLCPIASIWKIADENHCP